MHVIGNANIVPDALSRLHDPVCSILRKSANGIGVVRPFAPKVLRQRTYYSIHRLSNTGFETREKSWTLHFLYKNIVMGIFSICT